MQDYVGVNGNISCIKYVARVVTKAIFRGMKILKLSLGVDACHPLFWKSHSHNYTVNCLFQRMR